MQTQQENKKKQQQQQQQSGRGGGGGSDGGEAERLRAREKVLSDSLLREFEKKKRTRCGLLSLSCRIVHMCVCVFFTRLVFTFSCLEGGWCVVRPMLLVLPMCLPFCHRHHTIGRLSCFCRRSTCFETSQTVTVGDQQKEGRETQQSAAPMKTRRWDRSARAKRRSAVRRTWTRGECRVKLCPPSLFVLASCVRLLAPCRQAVPGDARQEVQASGLRDAGVHRAHREGRSGRGGVWGDGLREDDAGENRYLRISRLV